MNADALTFVQSTKRKFKTIMIDPPWPQTFKANRFMKDLSYPTMTIAEIAALNPAQVAEKDCRLFLWTTNQFLPEALGLIRLWGFYYRMTYTICKPTGTGRVPASATEFCIIATLGSPATPCQSGKILLNWKEVRKARRHSQKPKEVIADFESFSEAPRLELFARSKRKGWHCVGNQLA